MPAAVPSSIRVLPLAPLAMVALICLSLGCTRQQVKTAGNHMVVTADQIAKLRATTAYDVVTLTHADFLHSRGREQVSATIPATPADVYVDNTFYGGVSSLNQIQAADIEEIRFYQSYDAQYQFGSNHPGGVIQVITKH